MGEILIEYIARDITCESLLWSFQLFTNFSPTVSLLQGHLINAIAWNKSKLTESSTQTILLGTTKGLLFAKNALLWIWVEVHIAQLKPLYSFTRKQVTPHTLTTYCSFVPSFLIFFIYRYLIIHLYLSISTFIFERPNISNRSGTWRKVFSRWFGKILETGALFLNYSIIPKHNNYYCDFHLCSCCKAQLLEDC